MLNFASQKMQMLLNVLLASSWMRILRCILMHILPLTWL